MHPGEEENAVYVKLKIYTQLLIVLLLLLLFSVPKQIISHTKGIEENRDERKVIVFDIGFQ